jgi:hypothetical protein
LEFWTASRISFSKTIRPHPAVTARSVSAISAVSR